MSDLYIRIENLCLKHKISITAMCKEAKVSRGSMTDLKQGRSKTLSAEAIAKIAKVFDVSTDYLLNGEGENPDNLQKANIDDDIKFALFNGSEGITDEMFEEVKQFAEMVKLREAAKKNKG